MDSTLFSCELETNIDVTDLWFHLKSHFDQRGMLAVPSSVVSNMSACDYALRST